MTRMLRLRTVLLAKNGICSGIHPMALRSITPQSPASSISASTRITGNIRTERKARAAAFKELDTNSDAYKKSRYVLRQTIKQAKCLYRTKIESYYTGSDAHQMWQGLKTITDCKRETQPRAAQ